MTESETPSNPYDDLVAKEVYLHFTERYNSKNWVHNWPAWQHCDPETKKFWSSIVKLSVFKTKTRPSKKVDEAN
jgi:hypothetical protein